MSRESYDAYMARMIREDRMNRFIQKDTSNLEKRVEDLRRKHDELSKKVDDWISGATS